MKLDLTGKSALITGGSRGIGKAIVQALADAGAKVAFTYRSSGAEADVFCAALIANGVEALAIQADAVNTTDAANVVQKVLDTWGTLDILVNNAGITKDGLLLRMSESDWDTVLETNLKSIFNYCKAAYRPMMKQRSGKIVNMSSVVGLMGNAGQANYAASKAGIIGFSKSLAKELGARGVCVNVVAPGFVETDMTHSLSDAAKQAMLGSVPLQRAAQPQDIAAAVVFLSADAANYITGQVLQVDGGLVM